MLQTRTVQRGGQVHCSDMCDDGNYATAGSNDANLYWRR